VADLDFDIEIDVAPTVREADGLALSSRNARLSPDERGHALALYRALQAAQAAFSAGSRGGASIEAAAQAVLDAEPGVNTQYVEAVEPDTLDRPDVVRAGTAVAIAAFVGATRLIDNHVLT
jgi:pantoate--beta-alanine ligase